MVVERQMNKTSVESFFIGSFAGSYRINDATRASQRGWLGNSAISNNALMLVNC